jgi:ABC-type Mn2+/Zn2+ transport system permease subunit
MIPDFIASWPLFAQTYLTGWLMAVLLSLLGVYVVARDQIFMGAAIAQASTLGIALSMVVASCLPHFHLHALEHAATWWAVGFACTASYVMSLNSGRRESHEAVTAWIFLLSSSLSVLVVAHSPHGLDEIQRLASSSLIGATVVDTLLFAVLAVLVCGFIARYHRHLTLLALDPAMAAAVGLKPARWYHGVALALGLVVGCSIRSAGLLYTFGCLILPALTAKSLVRTLRPLYVLSPVLGLTTALAGFMLAHHLDLPPAQATIALQGLLLGLCWWWRRWHRLH